MEEFPTAYVIPKGVTQRSEAEANRLVEWLLFNGILVDELKQPYRFGGVTYPRAPTSSPCARLIGAWPTRPWVSAWTSPTTSLQLYAPPALEPRFPVGRGRRPGAAGAAFTPRTNRIHRPSPVGGVEPGPAPRYVLPIDSPTAVRALNALTGEGLQGQLALEPFTSASRTALPAGSVIFPADRATRTHLAAVGRESGLTFHRLGRSTPTPPTEPIERQPRILVLTGNMNQDVWSLRDLGFTPDFMSTVQLNTAAADPLPGYDVVWNAGSWPVAANATARARLQSFFAAGGGYIGAGANGANFLTSGSLVSGLSVATRTGAGRSAIVNWDNIGGATSPITGVYPVSDTAIMDPPTWFTVAACDDDRRRPVPDEPGRDRRVRILADRRPVGDRTRLGRDRPRHDHRRQSGHGVRHEPALPGRPRTGVADGRPRRLLGRPVVTPAGRHAGSADVTSTSAPAAHVAGCRR